jgi:hypothetical protein
MQRAVAGAICFRWTYETGATFRSVDETAAAFAHSARRPYAENRGDSSAIVSIRVATIREHDCLATSMSAFLARDSEKYDSALRRIAILE